jgi:hypothetical protein
MAKKARATFAKREREMNRMQKAAEKRERRAQRLLEGPEGETGADEYGVVYTADGEPLGVYEAELAPTDEAEPTGS